MSKQKITKQKNALDANVFSEAEELIEKPLFPAELVPWLQRDLWLLCDAMRLLMGIDADRTPIVEGKTEYGKPKFSFDKEGPFLFGRFDEDLTRSETQRMEEKLTNMMRAWDSGSHPDQCSPEYFIRWAINKGFAPHWYEGACELNLIDRQSIEAPTTGNQDDGEDSRNVGAKTQPPVTHPKGSPWSDDDLKELLNESNSGKTANELATFHGVKRQRVSALLARARDRFEPKASKDLSDNPLAKLVRFGNAK